MFQDALASRKMRVHRPLTTLVLLAASAAVAGCGKKVRTAKPVRIGATETGIASWYGHPYHGRRAANGEVYDMEKLTAAHRTLPFGTWVRVVNLSNGKTVEMRIQDRGPFIGGRIIDLSKAGARNIDMIGSGIAKVKLTVIRPPVNVAREIELFGVQVGAFSDKARAESLRDSMRERHGAARIIEREGSSVLWRVLVGEKGSLEEAQALAEGIRAEGTAAVAVRIDRTP